MFAGTGWQAGVGGGGARGWRGAMLHLPRADGRAGGSLVSPPLLRRVHRVVVRARGLRRRNLPALPLARAALQRGARQLRGRDDQPAPATVLMSDV